MKEKETFVLYKNHRESIQGLSKEQKGEVLDAIFDYVNGIKLSINLQSVEYGIFKGIQTQINHTNKKYQEKCKKNSENAKSRYNKDKTIQTHTNACERIHNDNDSDNENESDNDKSFSSNLSTNFVENDKICSNDKNNIVAFSDFNMSDTDMPEAQYRVRKFTNKETQDLLGLIDKIFYSFLPGANELILNKILDELEEQKAKGKYLKSDDFDTMKKFINQKGTPKQKTHTQKFIDDLNKDNNMDIELRNT